MHCKYAESTRKIKHGFQKNWLYLFVIGLWLLGTIFGIWYFQMKDVRPFLLPPAEQPAGQISAEQIVVFNGQGLEKTLKEALLPQFWSDQIQSRKATVINFWQPDCPCNRYNERHLRKLVEVFQPQGVRFVSITSQQHIKFSRQKDKTFKRLTTPLLIDKFAQLNTHFKHSAAPAVAIFDHYGKMVYFGPYSIGAMCFSSKDGWVESQLQQVLAGKNLDPYINVAAVGCYCPWL